MDLIIRLRLQLRRDKAAGGIAGEDNPPFGFAPFDMLRIIRQGKQSSTCPLGMDNRQSMIDN